MTAKRRTPKPPAPPPPPPPAPPPELAALTALSGALEASFVAFGKAADASGRDAIAERDACLSIAVGILMRERHAGRDACAVVVGEIVDAIRARGTR